MTPSNRIEKVAIVGVSGNAGRFMTEALLKTGRHTVTAITRADSQTTLPLGVLNGEVDYNQPQTLVKALRGQDALVLTISGRAPIQEIEEKLVRAAAEADVHWILPNEWSPDTANEALVKDVPMFGTKVASRKLIADVGKSSYIAVVTGFWYEFSLANPSNYGFNFVDRTVTLYDEGDTKISTSTWPQVGRAVAALLSLPIQPEGSNKDACLENSKNKVVYVKSFTVSQKDMLESALRVTNTKKSDWTVTEERAEERFSTGVKLVQEGKMEGFSKLSTRIFFPDGCGNFEHHKGTLNKVLNLPEEDLDEATKAAIERQRNAEKH